MALHIWMYVGMRQLENVMIGFLHFKYYADYQHNMLKRLKMALAFFF